MGASGTQLGSIRMCIWKNQLGCTPWLVSNTLKQSVECWGTDQLTINMITEKSGLFAATGQDVNRTSGCLSIPHTHYGASPASYPVILNLSTLFAYIYFSFYQQHTIPCGFRPRLYPSVTFNLFFPSIISSGLCHLDCHLLYPISFSNLIHSQLSFPILPTVYSLSYL